MKHGSKNKRGRRYTPTEKKFALAVYYQSPRAYRFLSKLFMLPSVSMLHLWLRKINIHAGWNQAFLIIMKNQANQLKDSEKVCGLVFDAIHLQETVTYNMSTDRVEGVENLGEYGRTNIAANYALVFMVRGIHSRWKQVVGHFFYRSALKTATLKSLLISAIKHVQETGFIVKFVTCDQDGTNRSVYRSLGLTEEKPVFSVNNCNILWFYDAPHLLKSVRNNLRKYDVKVGDKVVSWRYVKQFYLRDKEQGIRLAPKLSDHHIEKRGYSDMKVKFAAQIFSHTVAAGVYTHASLGFLPNVAVYTGELIQNVDKLFDSFNSSAVHHYKESRKAFAASSSHSTFLVEMKNYLSSWKFLTPPRVQIYCVKGWISNISALQHLWQDLHAYGFQFLLTRRLNQDPLEHLFGVIRSRFGNCEHPTPKGVTTALKQAVTNDLLHPPKSGNCEADDMPFLYMPQENTYFTNLDIAQGESEEECDDVPDTEFDKCEKNAFTYMYGYICRRYLRKHDCQMCRDILIDPKAEFDSDSKMFVNFKAENLDKDPLFGGLTLVNDTVQKCLREVDVIFRGNIGKIKEGQMIAKQLVKLIPQSAYVSLCTPDKSSVFLETYVKLRILFHYKFKNRALRDETRKKTRKLMKLVV